MKHSLKATSIVEALIVLLVVVTGIVGVFSLLNSSQKLANSTSYRIEAIQIARDGLEAFTNIRDTNAILFAADLENCWNVLNYNRSCIGDTSFDHDIKLGANQGITLSKNTENQFEIDIRDTTGGFQDANYRSNFRVNKDDIGFYTQSGGSEFSPLFTREIQVEYLQDDGTLGNSNNQKMQVTSIVQWSDPASSEVRSVEMEVLLTNWRK